VCAVTALDAGRSTRRPKEKNPLGSLRLDSTRFDTSVSSRAVPTMADDEEAVVLACISLVCCALYIHVQKKKKNDNTHAVWVKDYLRKRETFGCYNYLLLSDLVNHKAIWSNYMRIDIEVFEELFSLVKSERHWWTESDRK